MNCAGTERRLGVMRQDACREPPAASRVLTRAFKLLTQMLNAAGTGLVFCIVAFIATDIAGRILFNAPLAGVPELVTMAIVGIAFFQLPHAIASGGLIRSDAFIGMLRRRSARAAALVEGAFDLVGTMVFGVILLGTLPHLREAYAQGYEFGTPGVFLFPQWPLRLVVVIGCGAAMLQFLLLFGSRFISAATNGRSAAAPVASGREA